MVLTLLLVPAVLQAIAMAIDEGVYHRRRGLPAWERLGHPIDTLSVIVALAWLVAHAPGDRAALWVYAGLGFVSSLLVTKDEPVHARLCEPAEQWLHAVLFVLHPIVLVAAAVLWWSGHGWAVVAQLGLAAAVLVYQLVYWSVPWGTNRQLRPPGRS